MAEQLRALLEANTRLTEDVHRLTREIHSSFTRASTDLDDASA